MSTRSTPPRILAIVALILTLGLASAAGVAAQDTDTPPDLSGAIHQGTCDAPGEPALIQVGDFVRIDQGEITGSADVAFTLRVQRTVESDLDTLFGPTAHVFVVHDNANPDNDPVACGALGGVNVNGQITVGLTVPSADGPGDLVGVAIFGNTAPTGPTTQPASVPGQLPVQAYLSEDALAAEDEEPVMETQAPMAPTTAPTEEPTAMPTEEPTAMPTEEPTTAPTEEPTTAPTEPTTAPTEPTATEDTGVPTATEESTEPVTRVGLMVS